MNKISIFIFIIFLGLTANVFAQSNDEKTKTAIRKVMDEQTAAWNRGDIEGFMKGYWNSPQMTFVSGDNVSRGWQAALDRYKKNYDTKEKMGVLTFSDLEINVISKDAAVVLGNWALQREKDNPKGKFTLIFRKFKEGWRIVHDHTS
jgi:uncharacterized protein (TIGR02246 family)